MPFNGSRERRIPGCAGDALTVNRARRQARPSDLNAKIPIALAPDNGTIPTRCGQFGDTVPKSEGRHVLNDHRFSRRHFFFGSLLAGAIPKGGFGSTVSLSASGYKSPNEKLNIAGIGVGVRGPAILIGAAATENIVALSDVDEERSARGFAQYPKANKYKD